MAQSGKRQHRLSDGYSFVDFHAQTTVRGVFGDPDVRIVRLDRRSKKTVCDVCGQVQTGWYDRRIRLVRDLSSAGFRIVLELEVRRVACHTCGSVKRERLDFLADNPRFTKRFAFYVGRRCRQASIRDVAKELKLDWDTVKILEMHYMRAQIERAGTPGPTAIGIDEISIRKGHNYRIVVSDLVRKRLIWFGGDDRSEASMAQFYACLGPKKTNKIRPIVMDM
jgi:transposase